jgi:lysophospholipase L1-like esterase
MKMFKPSFQKRYLKNVLLLIVSAIVAILLCEAILQFILPSSHNNGYYIRPPHLKRVLKPTQDVMPGISGESKFITNSIGIRGDEIEPHHAYRILAIGGSTTECLYLNQSETWPHLLQTELRKKSQRQNVWVGNAGMSGKTTRNYLTAIKYLPIQQLKIDVVVFLIGINDLSKRLSRDVEYDPNFFDKPYAEKKLVAETFIGSKHILVDGPYYKRTVLWQLLRSMLNNNVQDDTGEIYISWRDHRQNAKEIRNELPSLSSALDEYARNINNIIEVAKEKTVRLIFMTQPTIWKPDLPENLNALLWLGGIGDFQRESGKPYYSVEALEKGIKAYNETLLRICREKGIECLDLASLLEKDTTVFYDDVHFNESGARKISMHLSEYILKRTSLNDAQVENQDEIW